MIITDAMTKNDILIDTSNGLTSIINAYYDDGLGNIFVDTLLINQKKIELHLSCIYIPEMYNSQFYEVTISAKFKDTGDVLGCLEFVFIPEFLFNSYNDLICDTDNNRLHLKETFEKLFYNDSSLFDDDEYNKFMDINYTSTWINLNHLEIIEKYRGKGYGKELMKFLINFLGFKNHLLDMDDVVFSVYPYPIDVIKPFGEYYLGDFENELKRVQNFYKSVGFKALNEMDIYVYNN